LNAPFLTLSERPAWARILGLLLLALPFNIWFFPARTRRLKQLSGSDNPIMDTWFGYPPERAFAHIEALGKKGRKLYAATQLTLDLVYPQLYTGFLGALLHLLVPLAWPTSRLAHGLLGLPRAVLVSDYLENAGIVSLLLVHPRRPVWMAHLTSWLTQIKFILAGLSVLGVVVSFGKWIIDQTTRPKSF
jgi:hypothetical protein